MRPLAQNLEFDRTSEGAYQLSRVRVLNRAIESAIVQAKKDASHQSNGAPLPPVALRPLLNFVRLPSVAARKVLDVLDSDEQFRNSVAARWSEADLGRGSWLFLHRPEGWSTELELLIASLAEEEADAAAGVQGRTAERRLAQAEEAAAELKIELLVAVEVSQSATDALAAERAILLGVHAQCNELSQRVQQLEQERQQAVRSMKEAEKRAAARLEESRQAVSRADAAEQQLTQMLAKQGSEKQAVAEPTQSLPESPWQEVDPVKVQQAVQQAAQAAISLGQQLALVAQTIAPSVTPPKAGSEEQSRSTGQSRPKASPVASRAARQSPSASAANPENATNLAQRPPRRTPLRLLRGVIEGTPEGVEQLLFTPQIIVIVDGYNISMEAWPQLDGASQRESLLNLFAALQARTSALIHVVFDGEGTGSRPAVGAPLAVRVHFSHAEIEADDLILQMVAELPTDQAVLVVSSDRRVQDGARRLGANVVSSSQLLSLAHNS